MDKYEQKLLDTGLRLRARTIHWWAGFRFRVRQTFAKHRRKLEAVIWIAFLGITLALATPLQRWLTPILTPDLMGDIQGLMLTIGGALIGAMAIASSFVLFAIQVNIERLPYGLFRRLSSDRRLLVAFGFSFLIAASLASLSLLQNSDFVALAILGAAWAGLVSLRLLLYAYRRSLQLVSPFDQLEMLRNDSASEMMRWDRWVRWMTPVLPKPAKVEGENEAAPEPAFDVARLQILRANPQWSSTISHSIRQAVSFARRAAEQGDREIAAAALSTVTALNSGYVATKGRTFFSSNPFFENPFVTDPVINLTLEELRQLLRAAVLRGDETQIELIFKTHTSLVGTYLAIKYGGQFPSPTHASLAAGYLERAVESVIPHELADTLMEGERNLEKIAQLFLVTGHPTQAVSPIKKMGTIGMVSIAKADLRPVTLAAMEQFTEFTMRLLVTDSHDLHFLIGELRNSLTDLAKLFLNVPEAGISSIHSHYLAPFYSSSSESGFPVKLRQLATEIANADPENQDAQTVARNLDDWGDGLFQSQKELLLLAVQKRSRFIFDLTHWIADVSEALYVVSKAPACPDHSRPELERHALWLFSTLSWIERDAETVAFLENWSFIDTLFDFGVMAHGRGSMELQKATRDILVSWAFEGSCRPNGDSTLSDTLLALAALSLLDVAVQADQALVATVTARLAAPLAPGQDIRGEAAASIRAARDDLDEAAYGGRVENTLANTNRPRTIALLNSLADLLSPGQA